MEVLEVVLSSGLLVTLGSLFITVGVFKNKISTLEKEMEKNTIGIKENKDDLSDSKVVQATILTQLSYITQQVDKIGAKLDKEAG